MHVLHAFEPPDGGVAQAVLDLARGLPAHGVTSEVAGPAASLVAAPLREAGVRVHELPYARGYGSPSRDAGALAALVRLLRTGRFDLLHVHAAKAGMLGRVAARIAGVPVVYSPHCLPFVGDVSAARRHGSALLERAAGGATDALLCVCEDERAQALQHRLVPPARAHVVHNGCAVPERVEPDPRLAGLRAGDGVVVGAVAVLREQKGLSDLIRAAPRVLAASPRARVAIVGSGPLEERLRAEAAAAGLDRDPRFALLPYEGPSARHLRALDVYVLPSLWEAFPIGVLEALACGVPQVATDVGGVAEAVTPETGVLVPPSAPHALADALAALVDAPARRSAMAGASTELHAARFTLERMVGGTAAVYARAAGAGGVSAAASTGGDGRATA